MLALADANGGDDRGRDGAQHASARGRENWQRGTRHLGLANRDVQLRTCAGNPHEIIVLDGIVLPDDGPALVRHPGNRALIPKSQEYRGARMRNMVKTVALVMAFGVAGTANAQTEVRGFLTGNKLLSYCQESGSWSMFCPGYIAGIADALTTGGGILGSRACIPGQVTVEQVRDIGIRFLTAHPERRHFTASSLVAHALAEAFPCKP